MSVLPAELRRKILDYLPRYSSKQAVTLPALHLVQDEMRCVPLDAVREIAALLDLGPAELNDAMSFYGFFRSEDRPLGRTRLWVCRSLPCMLKGGEDLLAHLCDVLHVPVGGTTSDGKFTVEFAECLGNCEGAPCMLINDRHEGDLTPRRVEYIIDWIGQLRGAELASAKLLEAVRRKGRSVVIAVDGSDEKRMLQCHKANANVGGESHRHVILQEDARKIEVLEEFLHGTQARIGLISGSDEVPDAEIHVKDFMLRHQKLLGLSPQDVDILKQMRGY